MLHLVNWICDRRVMEMASQFPHVKFNGFDIGAVVYL